MNAGGVVMDSGARTYPPPSLPLVGRHPRTLPTVRVRLFMPPPPLSLYL